MTTYAIAAVHHANARKPCREPFDHMNWLFELKHDGFRAIAFIDGHSRLISRNGYRFGGFRDLEAAIAQTLRGHTAILDGEIVCLDGQGRSVFAPLIQRQAIPYFYAFDLLWLDGDDWRRRPLVERKTTLSRLIPSPYDRLLYVDHLEGQGQALYEAACRLDLEGIVAKRKNSRYVSTRTRNWLKVKNPDYSQAEGRKELFDRWRGRPTALGSCDLDFDALLPKSSAAQHSRKPEHSQSRKTESEASPTL
jgi:bifunctional non-homologous end joining protein LigD